MDGNKVLIGGFMLRGSDSKTVILRGMGPSLTINGVPLAGRMANPTLKLMQGNTQLAMNDSWKTNESEVSATGIPPGNDAEAAIVRKLPPGDYTAILSGEDNTSGIGLVEVYDLDFTTLSALANISTRGEVQTGNNVLIGGFIVQPSADLTIASRQGAPSVTNTLKVIVRGIGPSLAVPGNLADPTLDLVNANGVVIRSNDDWSVSPQQSEIEASGVSLRPTRKSLR